MERGTLQAQLSHDVIVLTTVTSQQNLELSECWLLTPPKRNLLGTAKMSQQVNVLADRSGL